MRLWSLHPRHLDRAGLTACWRESLLAQAVLSGRTRGYRHHPQLERFRTRPDPLAAVGAYLTGLRAEAGRRGYRFDATCILSPAEPDGTIPVTTGQLALEWAHLGRKLALRDAAAAARWEREAPSPHPLFVAIEGEVEPWERAVL
ncbi:pyrimidine dimer DNA glycosylase/endonuclease V [Microbacterium neungamense]|uniref:pyrimidine dimer DNA glycosylase/endonuclease V n=1 Tax=Microbacterium neungamense TaxID=2810535 RepID=UPI00217F0597|nr:pyrimidine dimer DNA glycosylase/endonuclease V [Microbacterium neungamense]UWF76804.1 pyrimidine dimer DNA glycosylase [Microbacterium neungamense]